MKVNFNQAFKNFDGSDIQETYEAIEKEIVNGKEIEVTKNKLRPKLVSTTVASILFLGKDCSNAEEKMIAFSLSQRIYYAKEAVDITAEEASLIKRLIADSLVAGAYAQIANLVEGNSK